VIIGRALLALRNFLVGAADDEDDEDDDDELAAPLGSTDA